MLSQEQMSDCSFPVNGIENECWHYASHQLGCWTSQSEVPVGTTSTDKHNLRSTASQHNWHICSGIIRRVMHICSGMLLVMVCSVTIMYP
jgi:hypothetical protein